MPWLRPLSITLQLVFYSSLIAVFLGIGLAWCITLAQRHRTVSRQVTALFLVSVVACLSTPLVLHAAAWEATAGKFGWLSFSQTGSRTYTGLAGQYSGMIAASWIHGLYGSAIVAAAAWFGTRRVDRDLLDQAQLDMGPNETWWRLQLPLAKPWLVMATLASAMLAATEMTVADLYAVRTIADEFYLFYAASPTLSSVLGTLVIPSVLAALIFAVFTSRKRTVDRDWFSSTGEVEPVKPSGGSTIGVLLGIVGSVCLVLFPMVALVLKAGHRFASLNDLDQTAGFRWSIGQAIVTLAESPWTFRREYGWTLLIALGTATIAVPIAWGLASTARTSVRAARCFDALTLICFVIPGPIVGLMIIRFFSIPVPGFSTLYQTTLVPTYLALCVRAVPIAYWLLRAAYQGIPQDVFDAARLDMRWSRRMMKVDFPLMRQHLVVAGFAAAVFASGDVPVTLPVIPPGVVTVGTRLFALLHSGARHQEAALGFWYVASIVLAAGLICWWRRKPGIA